MALWNIVCGSEVRTNVAEDKVLELCEELATKTGCKPEVTRSAEPVVAPVVQPETIPAPPPVAEEAPIAESVITATAQARIATDKAVLKENGFAIPTGFFADGTSLYDIGTEKARQMRKDFDDMPRASDSLAKLVQRVKEENRRDVACNISDLRMTPSGFITRGQARLGVEEGAITALGTRLGIPKAGYLTESWPELRSVNWNAWADRIQLEEKLGDREAKQVLLRTRGPQKGLRNVFGVVSEKYGAMDINIIAEAIQRGLEGYKGAKAAITYDGVKSRIEVLFHTTVKPEHQTVGETFRAGVIVNTDDTGGGSASVQGSAWFVLCKNYTYTNAGVPVASIRHIGDVSLLTQKFENAFAAGLSKFDHFLKAWGYAQEENVIVTCKDDEIVGKPISVALPGIFRGILDRELVAVRGKKEENVEKLLKHWEDDSSSARQVTQTSRAAIVNAFTRFAHKDVADPFESSEIERAASALLYSKKPLPFLPAKG